MDVWPAIQRHCHFPCRRRDPSLSTTSFFFFFFFLFFSLLLRVLSSSLQSLHPGSNTLQCIHMAKPPKIATLVHATHMLKFHMQNRFQSCKTSDLLQFRLVKPILFHYTLSNFSFSTHHPHKIKLLGLIKFHKLNIKHLAHYLPHALPSKNVAVHAVERLVLCLLRNPCPYLLLRQ